MTTLTTQNPGASAEAIQHHYDVSNEFYRLWLDSTNTYSAALWEDNDTLELAQIRKLDYHINQAKASNAKRVLDVGCGWGSTLKRLVEVHGVQQAVGLTLSNSQAEWISSFNQPQIDARVESWSDHVPTAPYDAIISIGAFEHFAQLNLSQDEKIAGYRAFFQRCHEWLQPGGCISLQSISYENSRREDFSQFYANEIFPESDLPRLADIATASERLFEVVALRNDREHYARTLRAWQKGLKANRAAAVNLVGEEVVNRYEKYLKFSIIGFHVGTMGLLRVTLRRIDNPRD
ncbi:class I SAM-dependent methyltransferase [Komarekiella sp. 'clone 1']|uniref:Class I SAM-dependent methyltransferase n=1 Tax=Komarekiella delphini-convector SJRDD-AB1 TaxID=2593771 RepID=A0AA40VSD5_9NOST|nr:class I SAM-dependent methyltransferase [Komarekiella delphini-convector SJRDD-AB1]